jgi:hypothetical protein
MSGMRFEAARALVLVAAIAQDCVAAEPAHHLSFTWPTPTLASACGLEDPGLAANRPSLRFAGTVDKGEFGIACTVQIPRRRFDALYRFCSVENVDAVPRERYACLVVYAPSHVMFVYSYTEDFYGAPACEFACVPK